MNLSHQGFAALVAHEGIVPGPYFDSVGVLTYGIGHTAAAGPPAPIDMRRGMPTDIDEAVRLAFDLFEHDLAKYEAHVNAAVKVPMTQSEYDAAVSFHYNTGAIGSATWVKDWNAGNKAKAITGIMSWKKPASIIPRRKAEQALFRDGIYPQITASVWGVTGGGSVVWKPIRTLGLPEIVQMRGSAMPEPVAPIEIIETPRARPGWLDFWQWLTGAK